MITAPELTLSELIASAFAKASAGRPLESLRRAKSAFVFAVGGKGFGENQSAILASAKSLHILNSEQVTTGAGGEI